MKTLVALLAVATLGAATPSFAAEPSLHEVYQAANAGKLKEAQHMMDEVLQAHPSSGKAHYVEAELMTKQGNWKEAARELATAEQLAPGLPFANTQSVSSLREAIASHTASKSASTMTQHDIVAAQPAAATNSLPWGLILMGLGLVAFIYWASKMMTRRAAAESAAQGSGFGGYRQAYPSGQPGVSPQTYGTPGMAPASTPGFGSQVMGGLATGAAVGAGVVAGEALMHHFLDGNKSSQTHDQAFSGFNSIPDLPSTPLNDLGGNDFGITYNASWEDSASNNDSDWT